MSLGFSPRGFFSSPTITVGKYLFSSFRVRSRKSKGRQKWWCGPTSPVPHVSLGSREGGPTPTCYFIGKETGGFFVFFENEESRNTYVVDPYN